MNVSIYLFTINRVLFFYKKQCPSYNRATKIGVLLKSLRTTLIGLNFAEIKLRGSLHPRSFDIFTGT